MKKITFLTSMVALTFAVPAMAVPSNTSSTFPANGVMEEDYTYQNQATVTNLKVSSGTATTTANYANCPTAFPNSDEGAESTDECYTACTVSDFPAGSHIASVTGKNYQGANVTDTCAIATCNTGYTYNPGNPDLTAIFGLGLGDGIMEAVDNNGNFAVNIPEIHEIHGLTTSDKNAFVAFFDVDNDVLEARGRVFGHGLCSTQQGDNSNMTWTNTTTFTTMTPEFGTTGANYCYCKLDGYMPAYGGARQPLEGRWVYLDINNNCAHGCSLDCAGAIENEAGFHAAMFNSVTPSAPSCDANEISITWADASAEDIAANDAGSVTYGGDIRTPKKAVHKAGKVFTGWTFNTPSGN